MTKAITVRLDESDYAALERQADELRVRPGTLARMLVHAGLSGNAPVAGTQQARAALDRLVERSRTHVACSPAGNGHVDAGRGIGSQRG